MPWIRIQGLKKDDSGRITAGTATIVDTEYMQSANGAKHHSKQITREKLGRPLALAADRRSGIFRSQEYGIVAYDAVCLHGGIAMEDLRVEQLRSRSRSRRMTNQYNDASIGRIRTRIAEVTSSARHEITLVDPRGTSQICWDADAS